VLEIWIKNIMDSDKINELTLAINELRENLGPLLESLDGNIENLARKTGGGGGNTGSAPKNSPTDDASD
jgi:hypothetical protein